MGNQNRLKQEKKSLRERGACIIFLIQMISHFILVVFFFHSCWFSANFAHVAQKGKNLLHNSQLLR